jgi:enamine deaminase RidA (YjgF/YER057c/UK114 family)
MNPSFKKLLPLTLIIMAGCSNKICMVNVKEVYQTQQLGFSQAVTANGLLFASGMVGWDTGYQLTGSQNFEEQTKQIFINLAKLLKAAKSSFHQIVFIRFYVKMMDTSKREIVGKYMKQYFSGDYKPGSSLIGVEALARENLLLEIEIIAKVK